MDGDEGDEPPPTEEMTRTERNINNTTTTTPTTQTPETREQLEAKTQTIMSRSYISCASIIDSIDKQFAQGKPVTDILIGVTNCRDEKNRFYVTFRTTEWHKCVTTAGYRICDLKTGRYTEIPPETQYTAMQIDHVPYWMSVGAVVEELRKMGEVAEPKDDGDECHVKIQGIQIGRLMINVKFHDQSSGSPKFHATTIFVNEHALDMEDPKRPKQCTHCNGKGHLVHSCRKRMYPMNVQQYCTALFNIHDITCEMEAEGKVLQDLKNESKALQDKINSEKTPSTNDVILQRHISTKIGRLEREAKVSTHLLTLNRNEETATRLKGHIDRYLGKGHFEATESLLKEASNRYAQKEQWRKAQAVESAAIKAAAIVSLSKSTQQEIREEAHQEAEVSSAKGLQAIKAGGTNREEKIAKTIKSVNKAQGEPSKLPVPTKPSLFGTKAAESDGECPSTSSDEKMEEDRIRTSKRQLERSRSSTPSSTSTAAKIRPADTLSKDGAAWTDVPVKSSKPQNNKNSKGQQQRGSAS